jgi:hypothetical protein
LRISSAKRSPWTRTWARSRSPAAASSPARIAAAAGERLRAHVLVQGDRFAELIRNLADGSAAA